MIDPNLKKFLTDETLKRVNSGQSFVDAIQDLYAFNREYDKHGNKILPIRHLRCKVKSGGGGYVNNPAIVKSNYSYPSSKKQYKQNLYALNGETVFGALYQQIVDGEIVRILEPYSILQIAQSGCNNLKDVAPATIELPVKKERRIIPLYAILKIDQKVIFYEHEIEELKTMPVNELGKRMYLIKKIEDGRISFKHHMNAMAEDELKKSMKEKGWADVGTSYVDFDTPIPKLRLSKAALNFAIEHKHFDVMPDGDIKWKY